MIERLKDFLERGTRTRSSSATPDAYSGSDSADEALVTLQAASSQPGPADIGRFRREHRRLLKAREQAVRDLGGLTLEMVRRDKFKRDLLERRARDILGLEASAHDVEDALDVAKRSIPSPSIGATIQCMCGEENEPSAAFCRSCGRALMPTAGNRRCSQCASALADDARFCPTCGAAANAEHESATGSSW